MVLLKSPLSVLAATLALSSSASAQIDDRPGPNSNNATFASTARFVVEFSEAGSAKFRKRDGTPDTAEFYDAVKLTNASAVAALNFTSELFHGASFDLIDDTAQSIAEIQALDEVKAVWPVNIVYAPEPEETGQGPNVHKWDPHVLTKVNDAHKLGHDGKGVIIAVIDSGIDYTHPDLGGKFGEGFKVEGGWDFVGDRYDINEPLALYPDADPMDCLGHGTHVAGIIASSNEHLPGVAPNARLRAYKVFGCGDGVTEDVLGQAFIKAFEDGADIITASLGSANGFTDNMMAAIVSKITAQGTFVSAAAGNDGERGPFFTSNVANGHGLLTVGSMDHTQKLVYKVVAKSSGGGSRDIIYLSDDGLPWNRQGSYNAYIPPVARDYDVCRQWAYGVPIPAPRGGIPANDVLVLPRGKFLACELGWQLLDTAILGQANWVFFYNYPNVTYEQPDRIRFDDDEQGQATGFASINYEDGIWLEEQEEAGYSVKFEFDYNPANGLGVENGAAAISDFSSWGATLDSRLKPEISAPGGRILSTYLTSSGSWAVFSGTSMATPYIAGVAALFYSSIGGRSRLCRNPAEVAHSRIVSSGWSINHSNGSSVPAAIAQQGAGLVNALKVVTYDTSISPGNINLNDTMYFKGKHTISVKNNGNASVTYSLWHEPGSTARTKEYADKEPVADSWIYLPTRLKTDQGLAGVKFSTTKLTVPAGGRESFEVEFTEPNDIDPRILAMYGGAIHVVGSNGEVLKTTYFGVKGSLYDAEIWEVRRNIPVFFGQGGRDAWDTFQDGREFVTPNMPTIYFHSLWSTREESFDIVSSDWKPSDWVYPLVPGKNNFVGHAVYYEPMLSRWFPFPVYDLLRGISAFWLSLSNKLAHGDELAVGEYRIMARALSTYGKHSNIKDWQYRLSPIFKVVNGTAA